MWMQTLLDFGKLKKSDPVCVKSRTGYVLLLGGCPLTWASRLQTEIALSIVEAEYIALSTAMRDLLPGRALLKEIGAKLQYHLQRVSHFEQGLGRQHRNYQAGRNCTQGDFLHKSYCSQVSFLLQSLEC